MRAGPPGAGSISFISGSGRGEPEPALQWRRDNPIAPRPNPWETLAYALGSQGQSCDYLAHDHGPSANAGKQAVVTDFAKPFWRNS